MFRAASIVLLCLFVSIQAQEKGCKSDPLPDVNGGCPPGATYIPTGCCPDDDLYDVTTPPPNQQTTQPPAPGPGPGPIQSPAIPCEDKVNPNTGVSDCPKNQNLCKNSLYLNFMKDQCPKTCGYCNGGGGDDTTCEDKVNPKTGVSDCPGMTAYCNNSLYVKLMQDQCPKTCGFCGGGGGGPVTVKPVCVDKVDPNTGVSDCPRNAYLCNNSLYRSLMTDQCPKTCGFC